MPTNYYSPNNQINIGFTVFGGARHNITDHQPKVQDSPIMDVVDKDIQEHVRIMCDHCRPKWTWHRLLGWQRVTNRFKQLIYVCLKCERKRVYGTII